MTTMTHFVIIIALKQLSLSVCCAAFKVRPDGDRIPSKRAADHDGKVTPTADVKVAKHARINTSGGIFQLVQDLASPPFGRAGHAARRKTGSEDVDAGFLHVFMLASLTCAGQFGGRLTCMFRWIIRVIRCFLIL